MTHLRIRCILFVSVFIFLSIRMFSYTIDKCEIDGRQTSAKILCCKKDFVTREQIVSIHVFVQVFVRVS